jgi:shikimate 5-dehydrogenase
MMVADPRTHKRSKAAADTRRRIVLLGAGYGGHTTAIGLGRALERRSDCQVVLVDRSDAHELKPRIVQHQVSALRQWTVTHGVAGAPRLWPGSGAGDKRCSRRQPAD